MRKSIFFLIVILITLFTFTSRTYALSAPTGLTTFAVTSTSIGLEWTNSATDVAYYDIYLYQNTGPSTSKLLKTIRVDAAGSPTGKVDYNLTGLNPGTDYIFKVQACNSGAECDESEYHTFSTLGPSQCNYVNNFSVQPASGDTSTTFYFQGQINNCTDQTGRQLQLGFTDTTGSFIPIGNITTNSFGNFTQSYQIPKAGTFQVMILYNTVEITNYSSRVGVTVTSITPPPPPGSGGNPPGSGGTPPTSTDSGPEPPGIGQIQQLIQRIINLSVGLAFIALLVTFVSAGIRYIVSGGDPKAVGASRMAFLWGIVGIFMLILAWLILRLIEAFTGVTVTQFCLGFQPYCLVQY